MAGSAVFPSGGGARFALPQVQASRLPPQAQDYLEALVQRHRHMWLRDAEATLTVLDWRAYTDGRTLHVLDARAIGGPARGYLGFTAGAQLHELAAELLPTKSSSTPAAAVAVNIDALASCLRLSLLAEAQEEARIGRLRAAVAAVAAHELAHVADAQASGLRLPEGTTLDGILSSLANGTATSSPTLAKVHSPQWLRAFCHLLTRAERLPHHQEWVAGFSRDVQAVLPRSPQQYLDALHPELVGRTSDDLLTDILHTPAPAGFLALFQPDP